MYKMANNDEVKSASQSVPALISKFEKLNKNRCTPKVRKINSRSLVVPVQKFNPPTRRNCLSEDLEKEIKDDIFEVIDEKWGKVKEVKDNETQTCIRFSYINKSFINECPDDDGLDATLKIFNETLNELNIHEDIEINNPEVTPVEKKLSETTHDTILEVLSQKNLDENDDGFSKIEDATIKNNDDTSDLQNNSNNKQEDNNNTNSIEENVSENNLLTINLKELEDAINNFKVTSDENIDDLEAERIRAKIAQEHYSDAILKDSSDGYHIEERIYENLLPTYKSDESNWVDNDVYGSLVELRKKKVDPIYATIDEVEEVEDEDQEEEVCNGRKNSHSMIVQVNLRSSDSESENSYYYKESTIYDANKNIRIKSISKVLMDKNKINENDEKREIKFRYRQEYIVDELIKTEEKYIKNLEYVIEKYLNYMRETIKSGCLVGKCNYIFVNIENIFLESNIFLEDLKKYKNNYDELGKLFKKHKNLLNRYPIYCRSNNLATSYIQGDFKQIVKQRELELDDKLGLSSHLLKPIQRLGKYELLLTRLHNCLEMEGSPSESVKDAISLVQQVTRRGNDLITIDSIESNPFSIIDTGDFVMRENFKLLSPKRDIVLFLFKKMIIITFKDTQKTIDRFIYKESILITSLCLINMESSLIFTIEDYYKKKKKDTCSFQIECKDAQVKEVWMKEIQDMLWAQLHEHREAAKRQQGVEIKRNSYFDCKPTTPKETKDFDQKDIKSRFFIDII